MKVPTKTVRKPKPVEEVDLTATTEEDEVVKGNSDFVNTGVIVNNAKRDNVNRQLLLVIQL